MNIILKRHRVLFIDADECLLDWLGGLCNYYNTHNNLCPHDNNWITPEMFTDYEMSAFPGGEDERLKWMKAFAMSEDIGKLKALCLMTSLEAMRNTGITIRVLTARNGSLPDCRSKLVHNLTRCYGAVFKSIHFHPGSKLEFVQKWERETGEFILGHVDDKPATLKEFAASQYPAFGIMHEFNRSLWQNQTDNSVLWNKTVDGVAEVMLRYATHG